MHKPTQLALQLARHIKTQWIVINPVGDIHQQVETAPSIEQLASTIDHILNPKLSLMLQIAQLAIDTMDCMEDAKRDATNAVFRRVQSVLNDAREERLPSDIDSFREDIDGAFEGHLKAIANKLEPLVEQLEAEDQPSQEKAQ